MKRRLVADAIQGYAISGVTVKESPGWLQTRLRSIGQTPINNVVDITNYVLHESGQPLHAFDAAKITGKKVVVRTMPAGTKFITLDGVERTLLDSDLMICNRDEGMCIAGIFGGIAFGSKRRKQRRSSWNQPVLTRFTSERVQKIICSTPMHHSDSKEAPIPTILYGH